MRSVSQLRTSQRPADEHSDSSLNGEHRNVEKETAVLGPPVVRFRDKQIEMAHGAGGKASRKLVEGLFVPLLAGAVPQSLSDSAQVQINGAPIAITTDSFVVKPIQFPGGSIGDL
ncbi:MAG TPA: hypothetical protein VFR08_14530, partial [Candidatus Angelobacter sp.]|nr:hypothetical protein [Candidatus Angelobacter sp.]